VRDLVSGESAVAFETALQDYRVIAEGETVPISTEHVQEVLNAITETVFPHHALEFQQLWMNRKMFKPVELTTRQMAPSINCLNNALPFSPMQQKLLNSRRWSLLGFLSGPYQSLGEPSLAWMSPSQPFSKVDRSVSGH
jgi:predicted unusual protein kinase regulating ubiquinone biosynthesis (AarF/ABC1/UbiB family)